MNKWGRGSFCIVLRLFRCFEEASECFWTVLSHSGHNLAVDDDVLGSQSLDELAILHSVSLQDCVDAGNPQTAEVILLVLAVCKGAQVSVVDCFASNTLLV